jgi:hypothetical protein
MSRHLPFPVKTPRDSTLELCLRADKGATFHPNEPLNIIPNPNSFPIPHLDCGLHAIKRPPRPIQYP